MNPNFLGGVEIGTLLAVILLGMVTVQVYVYYANFKRDSRTIKILIAVVWAIEFAHVTAICYGLYKMTILRYGQLDLPIPVEMYTAVILGNIVHPLVQAIFTARIYQLGSTSRNRFLAAICWAVSGFIFGATVLLSIKVFSSSSIDELEEQWDWLILGLFVATAAVDLLIAACMGFYMAHNKALVRPESANSLDRIIVWTAQTGLSTSMAAVAVVILFALMRQNHLWLALLILNTGLYSNSLLSLLNGRLHLGYQTEAPFTISLSTLRPTRRTANDAEFSYPPAARLKSPPPLSPFGVPIPPTPTSKPSSVARSSHAGSSGMLSPPSVPYSLARDFRLESPKIRPEMI